MKKLEKLKRVIIKAVPEIVELKFGCKVYIGDFIKKHRIRKITDIYYFDSKNPNCVKCDNGIVIGAENCRQVWQEREFYSFEKDNVKIIGRDIQLADVLIAMQEEGEEYSDEFIVIDCFGDFWKYDRDAENDEHLHIKWQLNKSLDNQDKKTIEFLHDLLVKNLIK